MNVLEKWRSRGQRSKLATLGCVFVGVMLSCCAEVLAADEFRQWSDATGRFKVQATLVEVADGDVLLKNEAGKTLRIPIDRLSAADQEFLNAGDNPFEMVDEEGAGSPTTPTPSSPVAGSSGGWKSNKEVNWNK